MKTYKINENERRAVLQLGAFAIDRIQLIQNLGGDVSKQLHDALYSVQIWAKENAD